MTTRGALVAPAVPPARVAVAIAVAVGLFAVVIGPSVVVVRAATASVPASPPAQGCAGTGVAVQVLGSGGPRVNADRASTSYLVWVGGEGRMLVDIGGGAFLRFGQAGGRFEQLALIAISHLHPDHVSDLPALLWRGDQVRHEPLAIVGPSGNEAAPGFDTFLSRLFDGRSGAFQVLGGSLRGSAGADAGEGVPLDVNVIDATRAEPSIVLDKPDLRLKVTALGVPHANMPSLAYRVESGGASIVFGSDQTGANPRFVEFARHADILVLHLALGAGPSNAFHAAPAVVGRLARDAAPRRLVLSHLGAFDLNAALAEVKTAYTGPITVAEDLQCTTAR